MFGRKSPAPPESKTPVLTLPPVRLLGDADPIQLPETESAPTRQAPAPESTPEAAAPGLSGIVGQLAELGGRRARAAAERLLVEQGSLALGDARRQEIAAERQARGEARRAWLEALAPGVVYTLAIGFAVGGQVTGLARRMEPSGDLAMVGAILAGVGAAGLIEGSGLAFAILVRRAALAGRSAFAARSMMYLSTAAACGLNAWGHWGSIWAYPCTLGSVVALVLWVVETAHRCAAQLAEAKGAIHRQKAIRALAKTAVRRSHGRRIARIVTATMDPAAMERLAVSVVDPAAVAETAIGRYVAARDKTASGGRGWWPWRRSATQTAPRHVTATVGGVAGLPAATTPDLAGVSGGHDGGQLAAPDTASDEEFWRSLEADVADVAGGNGGDVADYEPASGDALWRYAKPLAAVPDAPRGTATGGGDGGDMATARKGRKSGGRSRARRTARRDDNAARVRAVLESHPEIGPTECAQLADVKLRTAERWLQRLRNGTADVAKVN